MTCWAAVFFSGDAPVDSVSLGFRVQFPVLRINKHCDRSLLGGKVALLASSCGSRFGKRGYGGEKTAAPGLVAAGGEEPCPAPCLARP